MSQPQEPAEVARHLLNAEFLPADAGIHAEGLLRILRRIPEGWGRWISCGPGWYPLLIELDTQLAELAPGYELHQVKEKFGTLRYYTATPWPEDESTWRELAERMNAITTRFEQLSETTCELCGEPGDLAKSRGWMSVRCPSCRAEQLRP